MKKKEKFEDLGRIDYETIMSKLENIEDSLDELLDVVNGDVDLEEVEPETENLSAVDELIKWMSGGRTYYSVYTDEVQKKFEEVRALFKKQILDAIEYGIGVGHMYDEEQDIIDSQKEMYYNATFESYDESQES